MLKVVGASWEQTRLTSILLIAVIISAIFAVLFYDVPLVINDGFYAATVYWSQTTNFKVMYWGQNNNPATIKPGVARAYYRPDSSKTGWATLEIQTTESYPDWVQAYAAGLLEGSLCWQMIYWHWQNTVANTCKGREEFCKNMRAEILDNAEKMKKKAVENDKSDAYWHQVNLFYIQLDGLEEGWKNGVTRSRKHLTIPHEDFLWMNSVSDLRDLEFLYNVSKHYDPSKPANSLALLKFLPQSDPKFLLAHEAAGYYSEMLKVQKKYDFNYHYTSHKNSSKIPGKITIFTSYPASLYSRDDFYQIYGKNNLTIAGSSIKNFNRTLWQDVDLDKLFMGPRVVAANRLANTCKTWSKLMKRTHSGTGNKQWLVIESVRDMPKLCVVEQMPGITVGKDMTPHWYNTSFWTSVGIPHFEEIKNISGYDREGKLLIQKMQYIKTILIEGQKNVSDDISMMKLMRSPQIATLGRSDILVLNITSDIIYDFEGDSGFSVNYNPNKHETIEISNVNDTGKGGQMNFEKPSTNATYKELNDISHSKTGINIKEKLINTDENSNINYYRQNKFHLFSNDIFREYDGLIDLKISLGHNNFKATAGPLHTETSDNIKVEPFQWSRSTRNEIPHYGQSDVWNFEPVTTTWVW